MNKYKYEIINRTTEECSYFTNWPAAYTAYTTSVWAGHDVIVNEIKGNRFKKESWFKKM